MYYASHERLQYLCWFIYRSLNNIRGSTAESLYDYNIESSELFAIQELVIRRFHFSWQLEQWRGSTSTFSFGDILSDIDLSQWSAASYAARRFQVLLSFQDYSVTLLINSPVLTRFLSPGVKERQSEREISLLLETIVPINQERLLRCERAFETHRWGKLQTHVMKHFSIATRRGGHAIIQVASQSWRDNMYCR